MILKTHFIRTFALIAAVVLIACLPQDNWSSVITPISLSLSTALLFFIGGYLIYGKKKGLFCLIAVFCFLSGTAANAGWFFSETETKEIAEQYKARIEILGPSICDAEDTFDEDDLETPPNPETVENAYELLDRYNKLGIRDTGVISTTIDTTFSVLTFGLTKGLLNRYRQYADCAEDYMDNVASWTKQKIESQMTTVPNILALEAGKCWPCGVASLMLEAVEGIAFNLEDYLKSIALLVLGLLTLFWIALRTLNFLGKLGTASNAEYFTDILTRLILVAVAAAFLHAPLTSFYRLTLSPLIDIGFQITDVIQSVNSGSMGTLNDRLDDGSLLSCACCSDNESNCNDAAETIGTTKRPDVVLLDKDTRANLMCMTCMVYKQTAPMIASGQGMLVYSFKNRSVLSRIASWATAGKVDALPNPFGMYVFGLLLIITFSVLAFLVAFRLMDIFLQLGFVIILTPFLIATFPFPATRQYTKKGWEFLVHSILSIIGLSLGVALLMMIIMGIMPEYTQNFLADAINKEMSSDYFPELYDVFTGGPNGGAFFIAVLLLLSMLLGFYVIKAGNVVVDTLSGMASGLPGLVGGVVNGLASTAFSAGKAGLKLAREGYSSIKDRIKNKESKGASKQSRFEDKTAEATKKGGDAAAKAIDKSGQVVGEAVDKGGSAAGKGLMSAGSALSSTGIGAIVGVPLMIAGVAVTGASKAAGMAIKASAKVAAVAVKAGARAAAIAQKAAGKVRRASARIIKNRMKQEPAETSSQQMDPNKIGTRDSASETLKQMKRNKQQQSQKKYGRNKK